ncbi:MAG: hypothetical protein ACI35R_02610, partial [Bacillus sp. (in: firmicutes)]
LSRLSVAEPIGLLQVLDLTLVHLCFHCCMEQGGLVPVKRDKKRMIGYTTMYMNLLAAFCPIA